jgi:glycosyltransferase involved in cell wall biosynthesis
MLNLFKSGEVLGGKSTISSVSASASLSVNTNTNANNLVDDTNNTVSSSVNISHNNTSHSSAVNNDNKLSQSQSQPSVTVNKKGSGSGGGGVKIAAYKLPSNPLETVSQKDSEIVIDTRKDKANKNKKTRVLFCGTYPIGQSNGYSRVVYYIAKFLGRKDDIELTIYGFQNYNQTAGSEQRNDIPPSVKLHDALATEDPKRNGFGEKEIATFLKANPQDMVIIFNDMVITSALVQTIVNEMSEEERKSFLLISYMDQVYPYQKPNYIAMLNMYFDVIITFTPYWKEVAHELGIDKNKPMYVLPHGFDHTLYYPIPQKVARIYYQIPDDSFAILNLNRNQPRKRWDHTMMAFASVVKRYYELVQRNDKAAPKDKMKIKPLRLVIATMIDGSWNLMELLDHELKLRGVPLQFGRDCVVAISRPQQLSDRDINILYNACDIGLNTAEGEGFGLCTSEHAAIGCPQVAQHIGGMQEFLNSDNSLVIKPTVRYYIDKQRDGIGGIAETCDPEMYANAIWRYYLDNGLVKKHGKNARAFILQHLQWSTVIDHFHKILVDIRDHVTK